MKLSLKSARILISHASVATSSRQRVDDQKQSPGSWNKETVTVRQPLETTSSVAGAWSLSSLFQGIVVSVIQVLLAHCAGFLRVEPGQFRLWNRNDLLRRRRKRGGRCDRNDLRNAYRCGFRLYIRFNLFLRHAVISFQETVFHTGIDSK